MALLLWPALRNADNAAFIVAELIGGEAENGVISSGDVVIGIALGLGRERGGV